MPVATEQTGTDLAGWVPGTKFYGADDGKFFVISADLSPIGDTSTLTQVQRPTVLLFTDGNAWASDLSVDFEAAPGTPHQGLLAEAGYTLSEGTT